MGNIRDVYAAIKQLSGKQPRTTDILKDGNGNDLTNTKEQLRRWRDFFSAPSSVAVSTDAQGYVWNENRRMPKREISTATPNFAEVLQTLSKLKNSKAPVPDGIPAELLKYGGEPIAEALTPIIKSIWEHETIPSCWKEGVVVTMPKKGRSQTMQ
ncbi:uncharacterized protein [Musca autumnalis]|uniref:uncharacterized protein n=1 Tax=Musca autumnalis TaxID=221902 RepID=UPI003CF573BA